MLGKLNITAKIVISIMVGIIGLLIISFASFINEWIESANEGKESAYKTTTSM